MKRVGVFAVVSIALAGLFGSPARGDEAMAVARSEERYRTLFTNMTEGFAIGEMIAGADGKPIFNRTITLKDTWAKESQR